MMWSPRLPPIRARIRRELCKIWADPPPFCRPGASPVTDLLHWEVVIDGPDGSPYAGGTFPVDIDFIGNYPMMPPKVTFKTKVFHPNINSKGEMMLDILGYGDWRAAMTIHMLLVLIVSVLYSPMRDECHPINREADALYESDIELYEQVARAWTCEYSSTPIVSCYPAKDEQWLDYCEAVEAMRSADKEERRQRRYKAEERRRRRKAAAEMLERRAASSPALDMRIALPRVTWKQVVAFLQGWSVALPFATFRRRFSSTVLPFSNYTGRACF